ncbi:MAG: MFS transporter, partial [Chloroflexota bacterium]|nr:MFS transporter [Chloroflexota bacterium]
ATAFSVPALGALIPELVPEDVLIPGNALRGLSRQFASTAGPILSGILVSLGTPATAFAFDAATFFVSAALVAATIPRPLGGRTRTSVLSEIRGGFAFVFSVQWLWVTIFGFAVVNMASIAATIVALPILVATVIGGGAAAYGLVVASTGIGQAIGAVLLSQFRIRRAGLAMYASTIVSGVALFGYGLIPSLPGAIAASLVLGISYAWFGILWQSALQKHVQRELLGRVTSVDWFGGTLLAPVAPVIAAFVIQSAGAPMLFIAAGVVVIAFALGGLLSPSVRALE